MLNMLKADLEKEMQSANVEEKDAQEEYESMMAESAEKRASDSKSLADKESAKADLESKALKLKEEESATMTQVLGAAETLKNLHIECDWLVSNFEVRKEARAGEVDAYRNMLTKYDSGLVAIVSDSYNIFNACENLFGGELKAMIEKRNGRLVVRPDSGELPKIVLDVLDKLASKFTCTTTATATSCCRIASECSKVMACTSTRLK